MQGKKTDAVTEEAVFAHYMTCLNYGKTAEKFGMPYRTAYEVVQRLGGDALAGLRTAMRADLAQQAWDKVAELIPEVTRKQLGTDKSSLGLEAARSLGEIGRIASLLEPRDKNVEAPPPNITLNVSCKPPPEVAIDGATVTTTLEPAK